VFLALVSLAANIGASALGRNTVRAQHALGDSARAGRRR
jgi:hypothetical protein